MVTIILLDVDGVLNPQIVSDRRQHGHRLVLDSEREALVRRLSDLGAIVWATTWPPQHTSVLADELGLPASTEALVFRGPVPGDPSLGDRMGKLPYVAYWLEEAPRRGIEVSAVVWIDDNLQQGAYEWALEQRRPFHLVRPDAEIGLTSFEVEEIEAFVAGL